jgi:3',5'-cyclic AMP phosphodiesterase CpdA
MRRIVHLSDFHFGWSESALAKVLSSTIVNLKPDLTILSGDFVEHATRAEFEEARKFVQSVPGPKIMVPGNHDLPFYNYARRVTQRLSLYREFITEDMAPFYLDDEIAVMGLNTARVWPVRGGSINALQITEVESRLSSLPAGVTRVLVTHHPFDLPEGYSRRFLVKRGAEALQRLAGGLDLLLAGHMHIGASGCVADRFDTPNGSLVFAQAGTAISKRYKGERNSLNVIEVDRPRIRVQKYSWDSGGSAFAAVPSELQEYTMDAVKSSGK